MSTYVTYQQKEEETREEYTKRLREFGIREAFFTGLFFVMWASIYFILKVWMEEQKLPNGNLIFNLLISFYLLLVLCDIMNFIFTMIEPFSKKHTEAKRREREDMQACAKEMKEWSIAQIKKELGTTTVEEYIQNRITNSRRT